MLSLIKFIVIVPRAISTFSWGNETIKHYKVEEKGNQNQRECGPYNYDLYSLYHLNAVRLQCSFSSLSLRLEMQN